MKSFIMQKQVYYIDTYCYKCINLTCKHCPFYDDNDDEIIQNHDTLDRTRIEKC